MVAFSGFKIRRNGLLEASTFALCLLLLFAFHNSRPLGRVTLEDELLRSIAVQISSLQPKVDSKSRILFLDDPLAENYALMFMLRLYYRQPDLTLDRAKMMPRRPSPSDLTSYDCIFSFNGSRLVRVKP